MAKECARVAEVTNTALSEVAELDSKDRKAPPADNYVRISERYEQLEHELEAVEPTLSNAELAKAVASLRTSLRVAEREARHYAKVLQDIAQLPSEEALEGDGKNKGKTSRLMKNLERARERMNKNLRSYDASVQRIDRLCAVR